MFVMSYNIYFNANEITFRTQYLCKSACENFHVSGKSPLGTFSYILAIRRISSLTSVAERYLLSDGSTRAERPLLHDSCQIKEGF